MTVRGSPGVGVRIALAGALLVLTGCSTANEPRPTVTATASAAPPGTPAAGTTPSSPSSSPSSSPASAASASVGPTGGAVTSEVTGRFPPTLGAEISGAAAGVEVTGLWLVDDQPGTDQVHLVTLAGELLATVRMTGTQTLNVEDLAVGPCPGGVGGAGAADGEDPGAGAGASCVVVADIGDNVDGRDGVALLSFPESVVADAARGGTVEVEPDVRRLTLDAGPVDAEALVVTPSGDAVLLDRTPDVAGIHVAGPDDDRFVRVGELTLPEPRNRMIAQVVGHVATAADLSRDGTVLSLRTYDQLTLLRSPDGAALDGASAAALGTWTVQDLGRVPSELQGEAVALLPDGRVATVAEGSTRITVTTPPAGGDG